MGVADSVGTVSEGKYADIIAVRGDVLRYINLLHDVDLVMKRGLVYKGGRAGRRTRGRRPLSVAERASAHPAVKSKIIPAERHGAGSADTGSVN